MTRRKQQNFSSLFLSKMRNGVKNFTMGRVTCPMTTVWWRNASRWREKQVPQEGLAGFTRTNRWVFRARKADFDAYAHKIGHFCARSETSGPKKGGPRRVALGGVKPYQFSKQKAMSFIKSWYWVKSSFFA